MRANRTNNHTTLHSPLTFAVAAALFVLLAAPGTAAAERYRDDGAEVVAAGHRHHRGDADRHRGRYDRDRHDRQRYRGDDGYRTDRRTRDDHHGRYDRRYRNDHYRNDHRYRFDVPRAIGRDHAENYRSYHYGRVYDSRHRHHHEVYRFPVYGEYGVSYYPYAYCEGEFFARGVFGSNGPVFDLRIQF